MQNLNDKLSKSIPSKSFLTPTKFKNGVGIQNGMESVWLNVHADKLEQSWSFNDLIGFLPQKLTILHRWKVWWMIPKIIHDQNLEGAIPAETSFILGKVSDNEYLVVLPSVDKNMVFR